MARIPSRPTFRIASPRPRRKLDRRRAGARRGASSGAATERRSAQIPDANGWADFGARLAATYGSGA